MEIRSYRDDDREQVLRLWSEIFPDPSPWNAPEDVIDRKLGVQRELFLVAESDEGLIGTTMGGFDGHRGWVYAVAVGPRHRRRGVGTALMRRLEADLARMGCPKLNLQVRGTNAQATRFYESLGYSVEDRISMGKLLEDGA